MHVSMYKRNQTYSEDSKMIIGEKEVQREERKANQ